MRYLLFILTAIVYLFSDTSNDIQDKNAWRLLTRIEKIKKCNIVQFELKKITTDSLVKNILTHPFKFELFIQNDIMRGFELFSINFNSMQELFRRKDAGHVILKMYKNLDVDSMKYATSVIDKGRIIYNFAILELLLIQPPISELLNKTTINRELYRKYLEKVNYNIKFSRIDYTRHILSYHVFAMCKMLNTKNKEGLKMLFQSDDLQKAILEQNMIELVDGQFVKSFNKYAAKHISID